MIFLAARTVLLSSSINENTGRFFLLALDNKTVRLLQFFEIEIHKMMKGCFF